MLTRRRFLRYSAMAAGAVSIGWGARRAEAFVQSPTNIRKFITGLPDIGPATKSTTSFAGLQTDVYNLGVAQFSETMHPDLPGPTSFWGYYDLVTREQKYLAGLIVAKRGTPVLLNVTNQLPIRELIPTDPTLPVGGNLRVRNLPANRIVTHLHGGHTPWFSDGTPFQWFTPHGETGPSFMNVPGTAPARGTANYYYPMDQSARLEWYHDHAVGITRTNVYAGIASALIINDDFELGLVSSGLLPDRVGVPLIIQDKSFVPNNIDAVDPTWRWGGPGSLWYPHVYEPDDAGGAAPNFPHLACAENDSGRWDYGPCEGATLPNESFYKLPTPSVVPEAFFDTILVNGGVYPVVDKVPAKRVRFRILNGSQARFFHLNLYRESPSIPGEALVGAPGPKMYQVGTEGGFLPAVAIHDNTTPIPLVGQGEEQAANPDGPFNLLLAPAERADVVIDFNGVAPGSSFILYNDAPAPFPEGDSRNDYFTGDGDQTLIGGAPNTHRGFGPNTRTLLKIVVASGSGDGVPTSMWLGQLNAKLRSNFLSGNQPGLLYQSDSDPSTPGPVPYAGPVHRMLTLNEDFDDYGRLIQRIGTFASRSVNNQGIPTWGLPYTAAPTESPGAGSVEVFPSSQPQLPRK
jgi:FtsP/CotA-like multicopper oxidase with cupredoxin domain